MAKCRLRMQLIERQARVALIVELGSLMRANSTRLT